MEIKLLACLLSPSYRKRKPQQSSRLMKTSGHSVSRWVSCFFNPSRMLLIVFEGSSHLLYTAQICLDCPPTCRSRTLFEHRWASLVQFSGSSECSPRAMHENTVYLYLCHRQLASELVACCFPEACWLVMASPPDHPDSQS